MNRIKSLIFRCILPLAAISLPFAVAALVTENIALRLCAIAIAIVGAFIYTNKLHREDFDIESRFQKSVFASVLIITVVFSFIVCGISIEDEWMHDYPLKGKVDDYGCYPQMFDAFQKGQLNIDSEYDLSPIDALENPYDTAARREATGEKFSVIWDRAYFQGKLYSYFGIAPVVFLYYPVYFLTGKVLSDALASAIMAALGAVFMMLVLRELCRRMNNKPPFLLFIIGAVTLPCGSLLWSTVTCANFYHLAVLSGICAVCAIFFHVLKADSLPDGIKRKLHFACAGVCVAATVASRPNMVLYMLIAMPLLVSIIIKRPHGARGLATDIASFCVPMVMLGVLIMLYNHARFGSVFDFGANYQLTLTDTSTYSLSSALAMPALYHFFLQSPEFDLVFPFLHPASRRLSSYDVQRLVYTSRSVGSIFFPCTWGVAGIATLWRESKRKFITAVLAFLCVTFMAVFDLCYGGVHLRYAADIMFILSLLGVYLLISAVARAKKGSLLYVTLYTLVIVLCVVTVLVELPLLFDNERDMILKYHPQIYNFIKG